MPWHWPVITSRNGFYSNQSQISLSPPHVAPLPAPITHIKQSGCCCLESSQTKGAIVFLMLLRRDLALYPPPGGYWIMQREGGAGEGQRNRRVRSWGGRFYLARSAMRNTTMSEFQSTFTKTLQYTEGLIHSFGLALHH